jgi:hypothetical protein
MIGGQEMIAQSTRDGVTTNVTDAGDLVPATVTHVLNTPTSTTTDTVSVTKTGQMNAVAFTSETVIVTVTNIQVPPAKHVTDQEMITAPNVLLMLTATMMDTVNVITTGQETAVTNTPVNATIIVMVVTDQLLLIVKYASQMPLLERKAVNALLTGPENTANTGKDHVTTSVMAVSDQTRLIVGTVLTTLSVTARMALMQVIVMRLMECVTAKKIGT